MIQPEIIEKILNRLGIFDESKIHDTPANVILTKDKYGNGRKQELHYRSGIAQMNDLAVTNIYNILFAVHQCAKYSMDTNQSHE